MLELWRAPTIADRSVGHENNFNLIRMMAALGVMVSHAFPLALGIGTPEPFQVFLKGETLGRVCVFAFFAISGFYITRSFCRRRQPMAFVAARAQRIYPGLAVMLAATLFVGGLAITTNPDLFWRQAPIWFVSNLYFSGAAPLDGVFATNPYPNAINGSLWSLKYEVLCYIGVFCAGLAGWLDNRRLFVGALAVFIAAYFAIPTVTGQFEIRMLLYVGLPFVIGTAFFVFEDRIRLSVPLMVALAALVLLCRPTPLFLPVFVLALSYAVFCFGFARFPLLQAYNRVGDYSYGLYIYAFPIQQLCAAWGFTTPASNLAVAVPMTLTCAVLSWHLVEAPAMRFRWPVALRPATPGAAGSVGGGANARTDHRR